MNQPVDFYEKQAEAIIGMNKLRALELLRVKDGISVQDFEAFCREARWDLVIKPRKMFEQDEANFHFIPYIAVRKRQTGEVLVYKRPDQNNGEVQLTGRHSIGLGGHVDFLDIQASDRGVIQLARTLLVSAIREVDEEVKFMVPDRVGSKGFARRALLAHSPKLFAVQQVGFLSDWDKVGLRHLAALMVVEIDDDVTVESNEDQLERLRFVQPADLIDQHVKGEITLENWSLLFAEHLVKLSTGKAERLNLDLISEQ